VAQQLVQAFGLVILLAVVTALARRLTLGELGVYGLTATLAVYLLVFRNSVGGSAVRLMAGADGDAARAQAFSTVLPLYAGVSLVTGLAVAAAGAAIAAAVLDGRLADQAALGAALLGLVTAAGLFASVNLDAVRAARLATRSAASELAGLVAFAILMMSLVLGDAQLWVIIGMSGSLPLLSGVISFVTRRRMVPGYRFVAGAFSRQALGELLPTAGWVLAIELSMLVIYGLDRLVLGIFGSPDSIGLYEGPIRAHNAFYALSGALGVATLPAAAALRAAGGGERLRRLVVSGSRLSLAALVPLCLTVMVLAAPLLEVWLGGRFRSGATALTVLVSPWLVFGALALTPNFLVGTGRARATARVLMAAAGVNLAVSLALTPALGIEGPAIGTAVGYLVAAPFLVRVALAAGEVPLAELAREAWLPAYSLGAALAVLLVVVRALFDLDSAATLLPVLLGAPILYWGAYAAIWLRPAERALLRDLAQSGRSSSPSSAKRGAPESRAETDGESDGHSMPTSGSS